MEEEIQISGKVLPWMVEGVEENRCGCSCLQSLHLRLKASSNHTAHSHVIEILSPPMVASLIIPIRHYAQLGIPYAY